MTDQTKAYALTFSRLVLGATSLLHGIANTFGVWGGPKLGSTTSSIAASTEMSADWIFYAVSIGLCVFGVALLLGMMTRIAAILVLVVAVWFGVTNSSFSAFFQQSNGCEGLLALAALCIVVATHGPGAFKVDLKRGSKK